MLTSSLMLSEPRLRSRNEVMMIGAPRMTAPIMALKLATTRLPGNNRSSRYELMMKIMPMSVWESFTGMCS